MTASDALGIGGVPGELQTFFWKRMGVSLLLALETVAMERAVGPVGTVPNSGGNSGQATSSAAGQIMLRTADQELQRQYAVQPKITIRPGSLISIMASESIEIP